MVKKDEKNIILNVQLKTKFWKEKVKNFESRFQSNCEKLFCNRNKPNIEIKDDIINMNSNISFFENINK